MNFTREAVQQLVAEDQVIRHRAALPLVDAQHACQHLRGTLDKLRKTRTLISLDRPKLNAERVWSVFAVNQYDLDKLDGLQFRTLCCDEKTALRTEFITALMRNTQRLKRSPCLYGMVDAYFSEWRDMSDPAASERLLASAFSLYNGKNPVVRTWEANNPLFSDQAARFLANKICLDQLSVDDVLKDHYVRPVTRLAQAVRTSAARSACDVLNRIDQRTRDNEVSLRCLKWITEKVLSDVTPSDAFYYAVSALVLSESAQRAESFQRALRSYVQNHKRLGDPRVRESSVNWRSMASEAGQRYLSWLARDSIIFFFNTILPNNNENRRRKDFWLRYHDRIKDFQVAVSEADLWKLRAAQKNSEMLHYSQVAHPTTSAFLLRFQGYGCDYVVVEFSEKGNAAYIFKAADFDARVTMRTPRFDLKSHLKFDDSHRILHMSDWEPKASFKLASEFGIRP